MFGSGSSPSKAPVKGKYVVTMEQLLVGSAPVRSPGFWDEFFLLEPRAQWLHSTLLSATCARYATAVRPWLRDFFNAAIAAVTDVSKGSAPMPTVQQEKEQQEEQAFGVELSWMRAANALENVSIVVVAVCSATLRTTSEETLELVLGNDDEDGGDARFATESLLALVHAANAVLVKTVLGSSRDMTIPRDLATYALRAKAAAAKFFVMLLQVGRNQAVKKQMLRAGSSQEDGEKSEGEGAAGDDGEENLFLDSMRAVDIESAAYAALRQTAELRGVASSSLGGPDNSLQDQEFVALLALVFAMRGTLKLLGSHTTEELDGTSGVLEGVMRLLEKEMAAVVTECSKSCVTASQGWGIRWLGFRAAGWLCGTAPSGIPLPNFRLAPCLYILRELSAKNPAFSALLFDAMEPLATKLFNAKPEEQKPILKYGVLRAFVEMFSMCLTCVQKDADFAYAAYADTCLDIILAISEASETKDAMERVGDLSLAFTANTFVLGATGDRVLTRAEHTGCFVDHILRLITTYMTRPLSLQFLQLHLKCVRVVRNLHKFCCFQTGPDARITTDWKALFLAMLRVIAFAEQVLRVRQRKINMGQEQEQHDDDKACAAAATMEGTTERNQLLSLTCEIVELVSESLCLGDMFADTDAVRSLWYETMRIMDVIMSLAKVLEPEYVVDDHEKEEVISAESPETALNEGVEKVLKQMAEVFNDAKAKVAKEGKEVDQAGAIELAESCRHQFLALRPNSTIGAGAEQKRSELVAVFSACTEERHSQQHREGQPFWQTPFLDPRYEQSISTCVQNHVSCVFQPVDK